jgi:hypothetical protein
MSGWDASRPAWDPQGGAGENTQGFGFQDFPEEGGGFPSSTSPGTPPAIFLQDYDQNEVVQDDFGRGDFGRGNFGQADYGRADFVPDGFGQGDFGPEDSGRGGFGRDDFGHGDFGRGDFGQTDFAGNGFGQQDDAPRGYRPEQDLGHGGFGQRGPAQEEYPLQDYLRRDSQPQDAGYPASSDYQDSDQWDPRGQQDADYAARMDPALRDFFASPSARQDGGQQAFGQHRSGVRGYDGPGQGQRQQNGYRPPAGPRGSQRDRWDAPAPRPGSRSARHHQDTRASRGGSANAVIAIGVVLAICVAVGAYLLLRGKPAAPAAQGGSTAAPTSSAQPSTTSSASTAGRSATATGYTLKAPAKAAAYARLASVPGSVRTDTLATAGAILAAAKDDGGKVTSDVKAFYQLSGGQVLAFTGDMGTFDPAKVMASLATLGTDSHTAAAGAHGGKLACATAPGSAGVPSGTVCVWVTTSTLGITEFFGSEGPEVVTNQAKAASDTLGFRDSVETRKS